MNVNSDDSDYYTDSDHSIHNSFYSDSSESDFFIESDHTDTEISNNNHTCTHYNVLCKFISPCCNKYYSCRHCHNDNENHEIDRYSIKNVICNVCSIIQPISNKCINCNTTFGTYFCSKCNFIDTPNESKNYYHCDHCNICRVGNSTQFFHCTECNCCLHIKLKDNHICKKNALHDDCCICLENLFFSTKMSIKLVCGHFIHSNCLQTYISNNKSTCPLCRKTIFTDDVLHNYITHIDNLIKNNPLTDDYITYKNIKCNDCEKISENILFHPYGMKCSHCGGYNTSSS